MDGIIWNPWHGCKKYSEGCENCYMYFLDSKRGKDGSKIYKVKTNFNLPIKKTKGGEYKIKSGSKIMVCMTSDFFLEEADELRKEAWDIMRERQDLIFWLQTKRAERVEKCIPKDFEQFNDNIIMVFTAENEQRATERIPILLNLPFKHKGIMCAPMLTKISLSKYLKTGDIEIVLADGENYLGTRECRYEWIKELYDECKKYNVKFNFVGTGNVFIKDGKKYNIPKAYQRVMALRSGLQIPEVKEKINIQFKCGKCFRKASCIRLHMVWQMQEYIIML